MSGKNKVLKVDDGIVTATPSTIRDDGELYVSGAITSPWGGYGRVYNAFTYSQDLSNAAWSPNNIAPDSVAFTSNDTTAPDGTLTADLVTLSNASDSGTRGAFAYNITTAANTAYVVSFWAKKVSGDITSISVGVGTQYTFDADEVLSSEWRRFVYYATTTATNPDDNIRFKFNGHTAGTDDEVHMWGFQLSLAEAGPYAATGGGFAADAVTDGISNGLVVNRSIYIGAEADGTNEAQINAARSLVMATRSDGDFLLLNDSTEIARITSNAIRNSIAGGSFSLTEASAPGTANSTGKGFLWLKDDQVLYFRNENGIDFPVSISTRVSISGTHTLSSGENILGCDTSGGAVTINLFDPAGAAQYNGYKVTIKDEAGNASGNNITINRAGSSTIDGSTSITISINYASVTLYSDGTDWFVI